MFLDTVRSASITLLIIFIISLFLIQPSFLFTSNGTIKNFGFNFMKGETLVTLPIFIYGMTTIFYILLRFSNKMIISRM